MMGEAVIKQAIATTIPDSVCLEGNDLSAGREKREKKSRMVTVDLRSSKKCPEHGDSPS